MVVNEVVVFVVVVVVVVVVVEVVEVVVDAITAVVSTAISIAIPNRSIIFPYVVVVISSIGKCITDVVIITTVSDTLDAATTTLVANV